MTAVRDLATGAGRQARAVRLGPRSVVALALVSATGVMAFGWPLLATSASGLAHSADAPWLFAALLPMLLAVVVATSGQRVVRAMIRTIWARRSTAATRSGSTGSLRSDPADTGGLTSS